MEYSEEHDLAEHKVDVDRLFQALASADCALDPCALVLDVGGGAGMHSAMLAPHVQKVTCTDFHDQNSRFDGQFVKLLKEKFVRNGYDFPLASFEFHAVDATRLIYRDGLFDLVVSFNAFEHIPRPDQALAEVLRVTRSGGLIYITFDPIWTCDTGSHFSHRVSQPWQHLLVDDDIYCAQMTEAGAESWETEEYRVAMNRQRLPLYRDLFDESQSRAQIMFRQEWSGVANPGNEAHPNFAAALARGYAKEELLTRGMALLLKKR